MAPPKKKTSFRLEDLYFYFDSVERDSLDAAGTSRKSSEVLALRERLLKLPEGEFEAVIKTMKKVVDEVPLSEQESRTSRSAKARQLYDQAIAPGRGGSSGGKTSKVSAT